MPNHVFDLLNSLFIVPRHTVSDIVNREVVSFRAKFLNKRLVSFYADITIQESDDVGHELHVYILNLARQRPNKGKQIIRYLILYY